MENRSLKDHLHCIFLSFSLSTLCSKRKVFTDLNLFFWYAAPLEMALSWHTRMQIAVDVANALVMSTLFVYLYQIN